MKRKATNGQASKLTQRSRSGKVGREIQILQRELWERKESKVYLLINLCTYHRQSVSKSSYSRQLKQSVNNRVQNMSTVKRAKEQHTVKDGAKINGPG